MAQAYRRRRSAPTSSGFIPPLLATLVTHAPDGPAYLHEMKLDGYRMYARLDSGDVCLRTHCPSEMDGRK
jgi:ATP-dependent DNA ligase